MPIAAEIILTKLPQKANHTFEKEWKAQIEPRKSSCLKSEQAKGTLIKIEDDDSPQQSITPANSGNNRSSSSRSPETNDARKLIDKIAHFQGVQASASITTQNQQLQQCNAQNIEEQPGVGESMLSLPSLLSGIVEGTNNSQKLIIDKSITVSSAHRINYLATFNDPANTILREPIASGGLSCMPATETNVPLAKEPKAKLLTPPPTSAIKKEASVTRGTLPSGSSNGFKEQEIIKIDSSPSPPRRMIKREVVAP